MEINKKILLVQLYSNGDCLYATAVARQIKQDFTNCYLTWAIASFCKNIIANNPYIDEVLEVASVAKNDIAALRRCRSSWLPLRPTAERGPTGWYFPARSPATPD